MKNDSVIGSLERLQNADPGFLSSVDYLLATSDFESFCSLMQDFKDMGMGDD